MIGYLKGEVVAIKDREIIILTATGVGYQVLVQAVPLAEKEQVEFFIHTHVREDAITLYGFLSFAELRFFELIISVNGIGPKLGMEILSSIGMEQAQAAIMQKDLKTLKGIKGLGAKTAERLCLELGDKIEPTAEFAKLTNTPEIPDEAIIGLMNLGYKRSHVEAILKDIPTEIGDTEAVIRYFLQRV